MFKDVQILCTFLKKKVLDRVNFFLCNFQIYLLLQREHAGFIYFKIVQIISLKS